MFANIRIELRWSSNHVVALEPRQNRIDMPQNGRVRLQQQVGFECNTNAISLFFEYDFYHEFDNEFDHDLDHEMNMPVYWRE